MPRALYKYTHLMFTSNQIFVEACVARGMAIQELYPKGRKDFKVLPGMKMGAPLKKWQIDMMFSKFEETRIEKLALVLSNVRHTCERLNELAANKTDRHSKLQHELESGMQHAKEQYSRMRLERGKYEQVLELQNNSIITAHEQKHRRLQEQKERLENVDEGIAAFNKMKKFLRDNKTQSRRNLQRVQAEVTRRAQEKEHLRKKQEADTTKKLLEDRRKQRIVERKAAKEKKEKILERQTKRRKAQIRHEDKRRALQAQLIKKNASQENARKRMEEQRKKRNLQKRLDNEQRAGNVQRLRTSIKNAERLKTERKIWETDVRAQTEKQIKHAFEKERQEIQRIENIRRDEWKLQHPLQRSITPGPADYKNKSSLSKNGGAWSYHKAKSDIDWIEKRSAEIPGPGKYNVPTALNKKGGAWSKFTPKTDVELAMLRAGKIPGPGEYSNYDLGLSGSAGVKFNEYKPKSDLDWVIFRANEIPAPGHSQPSTKRSVKNIPQLKKQFGGVTTNGPSSPLSQVKKSRF